MMLLRYRTSVRAITGALLSASVELAGWWRCFRKGLPGCMFSSSKYTKCFLTSVCLIIVEQRFPLGEMYSM